MPCVFIWLCLDCTNHHFLFVSSSFLEYFPLKRGNSKIKVELKAYRSQLTHGAKDQK